MAQCRGRLCAITLALAIPAALPLAQPPDSRKATSLDALLTYPAFYHAQPIVVRGELKEREGDSRIALVAPGAERGVPLVFGGGPAPSGQVEVRGHFFDVGRLQPDDPRLRGFDLRLESPLEAEAGWWPKPGDVLMLSAAEVVVAETPAAPTIRSIVLDPLRYLDQRVTVRGQFRGRNLYGDLPQSPGISRFDFVVRSADASLWVTGLRPKGDGVDLDVAARVDTNRWIEVSGIVKRGRGLVWLEGREVAATQAPVTSDVRPTLPPPAPSVPPEVLFSAPTEGETDVPISTTVRIQFSRDLDAVTLKNHVRVSYPGEQSVERGEPQAPVVEFSTSYDAGDRVLTIKFGAPLERFRALKVELLEGIQGTDGAPLPPWRLTFKLGG